MVEEDAELLKAGAFLVGVGFKSGSGCLRFCGWSSGLFRVFSDGCLVSVVKEGSLRWCFTGMTEEETVLKGVVLGFPVAFVHLEELWFLIWVVVLWGELLGCILG
jgi:hypothetical protein